MQRQLDQLEEIRGKIDRIALAPTESFRYYTQTVERFLQLAQAIISNMQDSDGQRLASAYLNLVQGKEMLGQERATLTAVFAADQISRAQYRLLNEIVAKGELFFSAFAASVEPEILRFFKEQPSPSVVQTVEALRQKVHESSSSFGVEPETWFNVITQHIDALHHLEEKMSERLRTWAEDARLVPKRRSLSDLFWLYW